ncbi:MAG: DUF4168 domain-containing protein [Prolixibacteraceae bacterium]|nr:DUF4168 domain-containing protein [Prolixibacteraceae bacterium]MBN2649847.1 DUF4168 domain-containing protein [Prolixibacteraceae bacterium]
MRRIKILLSVIILSTATAFAQQSNNVNQNELKNFASAYLKVQELSQESQNDMVDVVQDEGMEVQRYNAIMQSMQDSSKEITIRDEEINAVETINKQLQKIEEATNEKMQKSIKDNDLSVNRYQEIMASVQNDPELQEKLQEYLQQ